MLAARVDAGVEHQDDDLLLPLVGLEEGLHVEPEHLVEVPHQALLHLLVRGIQREVIGADVHQDLVQALGLVDLVDGVVGLLQVLQAAHLHQAVHQVLRLLGALGEQQRLGAPRGFFFHCIKALTKSIEYRPSNPYIIIFADRGIINNAELGIPAAETVAGPRRGLISTGYRVVAIE